MPAAEHRGVSVVAVDSRCTAANGVFDKLGGHDHIPSMRRVSLLAVMVLSFMSADDASSAAAQNSRQKAQVVRVIKLFAVNISGKRVRRPPAGIAGAVVIGRDRLLNAAPQFEKPSGAIVGQARYQTLFVSAAVASVEVTATLPGGTIRARGKADFRRARNMIRVIGGTGDFAGVKGTTEERALPGGKTLNVYRLWAG